jgi:hypothetical protein
MLQTKTIIKIGGTDYELSYPNNGQKLEIENYKLAYSLGLYGEMARNAHSTALEMLDLIDAVAYFRVLSPEVSQKYNLKDFAKIELETSLRLRKAFKVYFKWFTEFESEMIKSLNAEDDDAGTTNGGAE